MAIILIQTHITSYSCTTFIADSFEMPVHFAAMHLILTEAIYVYDDAYIYEIGKLLILSNSMHAALQRNRYYYKLETF